MLFSIINAPAAAKTAVFDSGFLITVALIVISTLLIAFIKHIKKDKCIKSFNSDIVTVYFNNGGKIIGRMDVENTGSEMIFSSPEDPKKRSYIVYKDEYPNIRAFVRYHNRLDARRKKERLKVIKKTYHPNLFRRTGRKINIFFKIIRDSLMDIFTALSGRLKAVDTTYASNEVYVTKAQKEAVATMDTTHDPLLEKYIGNMVVCEHVFNSKVYEISGILKDYTGQYIELLDVDFTVEEFRVAEADMVLPRTTTKIRNLGEDIFRVFNLPETFDLGIYKKSIKKSLHEMVKGKEK